MKMELQVNVKVHWIIVVHVYILQDKVVHEQELDTHRTVLNYAKMLNIVFAIVYTLQMFSWGQQQSVQVYKAVKLAESGKFFFLNARRGKSECPTSEKA